MLFEFKYDSSLIYMGIVNQTRFVFYFSAFVRELGEKMQGVAFYAKQFADKGFVLGLDFEISAHVLVELA